MSTWPIFRDCLSEMVTKLPMMNEKKATPKSITITEIAISI